MSNLQIRTIQPGDNKALDGKDIYFIHSTFVGTRNVQKEKAALSWILDQSKYKVLGKISADEKVLER